VWSKSLSSDERATAGPIATDIALVVTRTPGSGSAQVYLDGVLVATVNLARSSVAYRQVIYARHFATLEPHTFEVRTVGNGRVELDAFMVLR